MTLASKKNSTIHTQWWALISKLSVSLATASDLLRWEVVDHFGRDTFV